MGRRLCVTCSIGGGGQVCTFCVPGGRGGAVCDLQYPEAALHRRHGPHRLRPRAYGRVRVCVCVR